MDCRNAEALLGTNIKPNGNAVQKQVEPSDHKDRSLAAIQLPAMPD
jgi:hypothetical protein